MYCACFPQSVRRAQGTLNANKGKLEAEFAPEHKADGQAAIEKLDATLKDFAAVVDANDKQVRLTQNWIECKNAGCSAE